MVRHKKIIRLIRIIMIKGRFWEKRIKIKGIGREGGFGKLK
jgi:hypothetical protein